MRLALTGLLVLAVAYAYGWPPGVAAALVSAAFEMCGNAIAGLLVRARQLEQHVLDLRQQVEELRGERGRRR